MTAESPLTDRQVVTTLLDALDDPLIVPNLGSNTTVLMREGPRDADFYLWGAMGLTHSIAYGVALARPERTVLALDGDGSLLMGLGGLATIGTARPANLLHVVLDNGVWGNTGGQATHTSWGARLEVAAEGCGYPVATRVTTREELTKAVDEYLSEPQLTLLLAPIRFADPGSAPAAPDPVMIKRAFMRECLDEGAAR